MKKIIILLLAFTAIVLGWILISPLFINETVNEEIPFTVEQGDSNLLFTSRLEQNTEMIDDTLDFDIEVSESMIEMTSGMSIETRGSFVGADARHRGSGKLKIIRDNEKTFLRFEDFSVTNGPDLFVTLNVEDDPNGEHILVEKLKGNMGDQNYDISEYNIDDFNSVSIYCRAFSVEFATAKL